MPSKLKKLIRERMAKTGERYAAALAHLRAQRPAHHATQHGTQAAPVAERYAPDLIVARYFGRQVTFAILPAHGRCVVMLAPSAGHSVTETPRPRWQLLREGGLQ